MTQNSSRKVLVEPTAEDATTLVAELFRAIVCETVQLRGVCNVALAGGTTPHALYQKLPAQAGLEDVPWHDVCVYFGDERDVPQDHVESNYGMAQRTLLDHVPVAIANVHPMPADAPDIDTAAAHYEQVIRENIPSGPAGIPQFDLVLLGMGGDGHTASLFPGTESVSERKKLVMAYFVPVLGRKRMTFTLPLINAAHNVILMVTGDDKADAVTQLMSDDVQQAQSIPAGNVRPDGQFIIVLDAAAGRRAGLRPAE